MPDIKIKLMDNGKLPQYMREGDVCYDCYSAEDKVIKAGSRELVKLGFAMELQSGYEAVIRGRSGLSKKGIDNAIGTIDTNYRGEVMAIVINNSGKDFEIACGDRICQMAIREVPVTRLIQVENLSESVRGVNGFGSSGV